MMDATREDRLEQLFDKALAAYKETVAMLQSMVKDR